MIDHSAGEQVRLDLIDIAVRVGASAYVRQNNAMIGRSDLRPILSTIKVPTAVIVGENGTTTPPRCSREIAAEIAGASQHVPHCGHLPPLEQPQISGTAAERH